MGAYEVPFSFNPLSTCSIEGVCDEAPPGDPPPHRQQPRLQAPGEGGEDGVLQRIHRGPGVVLVPENDPLDAAHIGLEKNILVK